MNRRMLRLKLWQTYRITKGMLQDCQRYGKGMDSGQRTSSHFLLYNYFCATLLHIKILLYICNTIAQDCILFSPLQSIFSKI